ncbi:FIP-RBD domain-containing protein [Aphelenchoides bicaudatus]|nr:FIP-RBD domain-containing protein [Aphelenchoides bicaudatus]
MVEFLPMNNSSENESTFIEFTSIANEISNLSKRLADCQEEKDMLSEERSRLRTGTALLQERIHSLEDQYANAEQRWEEKLKEESTRSKDIMARLEREKKLELENMGYKQQFLEKEVQTLRKEKERQENTIEELQIQLARLQDDLEDSKSLNEQLEKEKRELRSEFENFRKEATTDMVERDELVDSLTKQTEELRQQRSGRPRHGSMSDQILNLEEEIERVRSDNKSLRNQNEELRAQLLQESVEAGQMLLADGPSLAAELNGLDTDELMNALRDQELCNQKLRSYIDNILSRVVEHYPEILEIGAKSANS